MKTLRSPAVWAIVCLIIAACASVTREDQAKIETEELAKDVQDELTIGREIAAKLLGHLGAYENPAALEYVNLVGQTIAERSGRPEIQFHFAVLASDQVDAFATPGGFIFVTRGLLRTVRSESELAVVLGHEISHVNERHMYLELAPKKEDQTGKTLSLLMSRGRADLGRSITEMVNRGVKILLESGLPPQQEREADEAGVVYAEAAGYNPTALGSFLKRVAINRDKKLGKNLSRFPERIQQAEAFAKANGLENKMVADAKTLDQRFKSALAAVRAPSSK